MCRGGIASRWRPLSRRKLDPSANLLCSNFPGRQRLRRIEGKVAVQIPERLGQPQVMGSRSGCEHVRRLERIYVDRKRR